MELTWEKGDDDRAKMLTRDFTKEEMRQMDFQAYLGSESEDGGSGSDVAVSVSGSDDDDDEDSDGEHKVGGKLELFHKVAAAKL